MNLMGARVCQCLRVSTPSYLCKSFNLTPGSRLYLANLFVFIAFEFRVGSSIHLDVHSYIKKVPNERPERNCLKEKKKAYKKIILKQTLYSFQDNKLHI